MTNNETRRYDQTAANIRAAVGPGYQVTVMSEGLARLAPKPQVPTLRSSLVRLVRAA